MSRYPNNLEQVQSLLRLIDVGVIQPEIMQSLHTVIKNDPVARQFYIRQMHLRTSLLWSFASDDFHQEVAQIPFQGRRSLAKKLQRIEQKPRNIFFPTKIQFGLLFVLMSFSLWASYSFFKQTFFATVASTHQIKSIENKTANSDSKQKQREQQTLTEGTVELLLPTGVKVFIAAPATFQVTGKNEITLSHGMLIAKVTSEEGKGFTVKTPRGPIIDLGTIFGVEVEDSGTSSVQVFKGRVDVVNSLGVIIPLSAGSAVRCQAGEEQWGKLEKLSKEFYAVLEKQTLLPEIVPVGDVGEGIPGNDLYLGTSYMMYSVMPIIKRFLAPELLVDPWLNSAEHFVMVHFDEPSQTWKLHQNENLVDFEPVSSDLIIATVKPDAIDSHKRKVSFFKEEYGTIHGISYGCQVGDMTIRSDWFRGEENNGEFTLNGTYFIRKSK